MNKLFLILGIGVIVVVAGIIVADVFIFDDQGNPVYEYSYILPNDATCDLHWLRPRIHYDMGLFPNYISYIHPQMVVGFPQELTNPQLTQLSDILNRTTETCNEPKDVAVKYIINLNPDNFNSNFGSVTPFKPFYYSDGINVTILVLGNPSALDKTAMKDKLCEMWFQENVK